MTIEALKMVKDKETKNITVTYGEKGLIYKQEIDMVNEKRERIAPSSSKIPTL